MNIQAIEKIDFRKRNSWPLHEYMALEKQDALCIGTQHYQGLSYFWAYKYKYQLRDASGAERRRVHNLFLKNDLKMTGSSKDHDAIIKNVFKIKSI